MISKQDSIQATRLALEIVRGCQRQLATLGDALEEHIADNDPACERIEELPLRQLAPLDIDKVHFSQ